MKPETIMRLDALWAGGDWSDRKDSEKVKQCKTCMTYFSPGTSTQQLLTHASKCQSKATLAAHHDSFFKRPRVDPGSFVDPSRINAPSTITTTVPSVTVHADMPTPQPATHSLPPPLILTAHIAEDVRDPLRARVRELQIREKELEHMIQDLMHRTNESVYMRTLDYLRVVQTAINDVTARQHKLDAETGMVLETVRRPPQGLQRDPLGRDPPLPLPLMPGPGDGMQS